MQIEIDVVRQGLVEGDAIAADVGRLQAGGVIEVGLVAAEFQERAAAGSEGAFVIGAGRTRPERGEDEGERIETACGHRPLRGACTPVCRPPGYRPRGYRGYFLRARS